MNRSLDQVAVIGSASTNDPLVIDIAQKVGVLLASLDCHLITGGLSGVMLEVSKGFKTVEAEAQVIGILPSYDPDTANEYVDIKIPTGMDVGRNQLVVSSASVVIAIGGGSGTLSEIALAAQLQKPIILMKGTGGWVDEINSKHLDQRMKSELHHVEDFEQLGKLLPKLLKNKTSSVVIDSGSR